MDSSSDDPNLTPADKLVLKSLARDIYAGTKGVEPSTPESLSHDSGYESQGPAELSDESLLLPQRRTSRNVAQDLAMDESSTSHGDSDTISQLKAFNDPQNPHFEPTVFTTWDLADVKLPSILDQFLNRTYIPFAKTVVRRPTDVVMLTHITLYLSTSVPSALYLFYSFSYAHAVLHWIMQTWYAGAYTLLMHQHIHMHGILSPRYSWLDWAFPYILDPLMGHTWNTYFFHHVKHHHVESNGPEDISSTIRYQRDNAWHFAHYLGRFLVLGVYDLSVYFYQKGKTDMLVGAVVSEVCCLSFILCMANVNFRAALFTLILPLALMRFGLMAGNWGQHAFVDPDEPESDFRSSITLIDVASNRYCYNDGYHTSHHLNPLRHWREHPVAFLQQKQRYIEEQALVFKNIDYLMLTVRLFMKDYAHLAKCLVPIGDQVNMSQTQIADFLRRRTRRFTEEDIARLFSKGR